MLKHRLFNLVVAIALVIVIASTVREAIATTAITCDSLPSRHSLHTKFLKEADMWVLRTEDGPTGVDGGLLELMSAYRTCSR